MLVPLKSLHFSRNSFFSCDKVCLKLWRKAALILMKNSQFDRTLRSCVLIMFLFWNWAFDFCGKQKLSALHVCYLGVVAGYNVVLFSVEYWWQVWWDWDKNDLARQTLSSSHHYYEPFLTSHVITSSCHPTFATHHVRGYMKPLVQCHSLLLARCQYSFKNSWTFYW